MAKCSFWNNKILSVIAIFLISVIQNIPCVAEGSVSGAKVVYFGLKKEEEFNAKLKPVFFEQSRNCKKCEIENFTPYAQDGEIDLRVLQDKIKTLPEDISFVFFDFNLKVTEENKELVQLLNQKAKAGLVIVATAGIPKADEASGPLAKTVLGQVDGVLLIGELGERDRLIPTGFYGPEMLTALRPPKDKIGQGYSPLIFAAALAEHWHKKKPDEWVAYFKSKKSKTRKIWMDLNDLF